MSGIDFVSGGWKIERQTLGVESAEKKKIDFRNFPFYFEFGQASSIIELIFSSSPREISVVIIIILDGKIRDDSRLLLKLFQK